MKLHDFLWILPFGSFSIGYLCVALFSSNPSIKVPSLIGNNSAYAATILSEKNLNLRIISHKEDSDLPDGTILSQNPGAGHTVKANQTIYCVLSEKPKAFQAPLLVGKNKKQLDEYAQQETIKIKYLFIESSYPTNLCIGQIPQAGKPLTQKTILAYLAVNNNTVIFPDFQAKQVTEVNEFLQPYNLYPVIIHKGKIENEHHCTTCRVINQKPLPGSIVNLAKPLTIHLQVN